MPRRSTDQPLSPAWAEVAATLPHLLIADEVAELLRTTREAVYARIERGKLPGVVRDGRRVLILRDELLRSLDERRAVSPSESG